MELEISETGLIGMLGMLFGFLIACCRQIEQSRCTNIDLWGLKCNRDPLKDNTVLNMDQQTADQRTDNVEMTEIENGNNTNNQSAQNPLAQNPLAQNPLAP